MTTRPAIASTTMFNEGSPPSSHGSPPAGIVGREDIRFAAHLPEPAQRIVRAIADESDELNVLSHSLHGRREQIREAKGHAQGKIYELQHPLSSHRNNNASAIEAQQKIITECQSDLSRLEVRMAEVGAKARCASRLIESARDLVRRAAKPITLYSGVSPAPPKGQTAAEAVEMRRRRLRELEADFSRTKVAPKLSGDMKAQEIERIEVLAKQGAPNAFATIERGHAIIWPTTTADLIAEHGGVVVPDVLAIIAHLNRDAMIAAVEREIDLMADDENALSDIDCEKKLAQIVRDRIAVEREEVAFVNMANAHGGNILFRADTDPRALLGLGDDMPAPRRD